MYPSYNSLLSETPIESALAPEEEAANGERPMNGTVSGTHEHDQV